MSARKSVFISHSSKDFAIADDLRERLEAKGVSCWIAPRDIPPGTAYYAQISPAVEQCSALFLLLSQAANKSGMVAREVHAALEAQKPIIPLRIRNVRPDHELKYLTSPLQWVDVFESPLADRVSYFVSIVHAIEAGSAYPPPATPRRTVAARAERLLEQVLRHKLLAATASVLLLAGLGTAGIILQQSTRATVVVAAQQMQSSAADLARTGEGMRRGLANAKQETSENPRKELANLGVPWSPERFLEAVTTGDLDTVRLFLAGGMAPDVPYQGCSVIWYAIARGMPRAREQMDLFVERHFDVNAERSCQPSASSQYSGTAMDAAITYGNDAVVEALLAHGARVTSAQVAKMAGLDTPFARKYAPLLRNRLANPPGRAAMSPMQVLQARGIPADASGVASAVEAKDMEALQLFRGLGIAPDHAQIFAALNRISGDETAFTEALRATRTMGFDLNRPGWTDIYRDGLGETLLTLVVRSREDGATRTLLAEGAKVTPAVLEALQFPYGTGTTRELNPSYPSRWRAELTRLAKAPGACNATTQGCAPNR